MARHKTGSHAEAKTTFADALRWMADMDRSGYWAWFELIECRGLRQEAEALLKE